jgi:hypothetical protein
MGGMSSKEKEPKFTNIESLPKTGYYTNSAKGEKAPFKKYEQYVLGWDQDRIEEKREQENAKQWAKEDAKAKAQNGGKVVKKKLAKSAPKSTSNKQKKPK